MEQNKKQVDVLKEKIKDFKPILTEKIGNCSQVFITAHKQPDFDAIASLGAAALICKRLKQAPYIVIGDERKDLPDEIVSMIDKLKEKFIVLNMDDYESKRTNNDLLIMVDVNKEYMTCMENKYKQFNDIIIIDHHLQDDDTVKNSDKLILKETSSCSELLTILLRQYGITSSDKNYYTFLLAGIFLDTNKCANNMYPSTYETIKNLIESGANQEKVEKLFSLDFESDRKVHRLIDRTHFKNIRIATAISGEEEFSKEDIAKAADYLLDYNCDLSVACGKNKDGKYFVSARTKNESIGIDEIMRIFNGGGGNLSSASCPPLYVDPDKETSLVEKEIEDKLIKILTYKNKEV